MHDKEIQELKKELKESKEYIDSDKKDKSKAMNKFDELNKEIQKHIKEKQIIEQELNKEKQELTISKIKINDLNFQNELLNRRIDDLLRPIDFLKKESDTIKKLSKESEEAKIKRLNIINDANRSNTIDDIIKSYEDLSTPTKIPQSVRKRDDKARTLVPKYNEKSNRLKNLEKEYKNIDSTTLENSKLYEHELNISDSRIKYLDKII